MDILLKVLKSILPGSDKNNKQKLFIVEKLEPWVTNEVFSVDECDSILEDINKHQYSKKGDGYSDEFYSALNKLLYGCYMAGATDGITDLSPEVYNKLKENFEKL